MAIFFRPDNWRGYIYARCDNCDEVWEVAALNSIEDPDSRLSMGAEVPAGECPVTSCGGLCYVVRTGDS